MDERTRRFIRERDTVLLAGNVDACTLFMLKHNPLLDPPSSREVAEMMMHKAITGARSLPMEYRVKSYCWLKARNLTSMDDGDVRAEAERH